MIGGKFKGIDRTCREEGIQVCISTYKALDAKRASVPV